MLSENCNFDGQLIECRRVDIFGIATIIRNTVNDGEAITQQMMSTLQLTATQQLAD